MSFVLKSSSSYKWPVDFSQPSDGGIREKQSFEAEFKRLPQSRINEIKVLAQRRAKAEEAGEESDDSISDISLADEILVGWDGITDGDNEVPFTKAAKRQLLEIPMLAAALVESYFESLIEEKRKN